jgi:hypothetical protein
MAFGPNISWRPQTTVFARLLKQVAVRQASGAMTAMNSPYPSPCTVLYSTVWSHLIATPWNPQFTVVRGNMLDKALLVQGAGCAKYFAQRAERRDGEVNV